MKKLLAFIICMSIVLTLVACTGEELPESSSQALVNSKESTHVSETTDEDSSEEESSSVIIESGGIILFGGEKSTHGVREFREKLGKIQSDFMYRGDCYNIAPAYIRENKGFNIYKFEEECASFLEYDGGIYPLGEFFGGFGVVAFALGDLNGDGVEELYFTYSWGSGLHRSHLGCFDFAAKAMKTNEKPLENGDMVFAAEDGRLKLYKGKIIRPDLLIPLIEKDEYLGEVKLENGVPVY